MDATRTRWEDALGTVERASAHPQDLQFHNFGLVELIEARERRRLDARDRLRTAREMFIGTGGGPSPSGSSPSSHLRKVFSRLGITYRSHLDRALPQRSDVALRV